MKTVNKDEFNQLTIHDEPVLIDFFAEWCPPCKRLSPILAEIQDELDLRIYTVDVDQEPELAKELGIQAMPTLILYRNGEEVGERIVGAMPKNQLKPLIESRL